jgi:hypothetical protein
VTVSAVIGLALIAFAVGLALGRISRTHHRCIQHLNTIAQLEVTIDALQGGHRQHRHPANSPTPERIYR